MIDGVIRDMTPEEIAEANTPPPVPASVSMRQARLALLGAGILSQVDAAIAGIADPTARVAAQIDWEYATEVRRQSPLITALAPALGLTSEDVDNLFYAAAAIQ
jgi:hypothetical protein